MQASSARTWPTRWSPAGDDGPRPRRPEHRPAGEPRAPRSSSGSVEFVEGSILDEALVEECVAATDVCLHLAAAVGVQLILDRPLDSLLRNVRGSDIVISAVAERRRQGPGRLLLGGLRQEQRRPARRELRPASSARRRQPRWAYATAKAFGEVLANAYHHETEPEAIVVRLFNTVGPRQTGAYGMVLPRFVRQALSGEDLTVYGDGTQTRCFTHVADVVDGDLLLLCDATRLVGHAFNIGSPREISIIDLAAPGDRAHRLGVGGSGWSPTRRPTARASRRSAAATRTSSLIDGVTGWAPTRTIDDMIDDVIADQEPAMRGERGRLRWRDGVRLVLAFASAAALTARDRAAGDRRRQRAPASSIARSATRRTGADPVPGRRSRCFAAALLAICPDRRPAEPLLAAARGHDRALRSSGTRRRPASTSRPCCGSPSRSLAALAPLERRASAGRSSDSDAANLAADRALGRRGRQRLQPDGQPRRRRGQRRARSRRLRRDPRADRRRRRRSR